MLFFLFSSTKAAKQFDNESIDMPCWMLFNGTWELEFSEAIPEAWFNELIKVSICQCVLVPMLDKFKWLIVSLFHFEVPEF